MTSTVITRRALIATAAAFTTGQAFAQSVRTRVRLETDRGVIVAELADDKAPITVANFLRYVDSRHLDGAVFYRASRAPGVEPPVGFIEGGVKDPAKLFAPIAHESTLTTGLKHQDGTLSMARFAPGTATSDFSILCGGDPSYMDAHPEMTGDNLGYAAFGQVIEGMDVARAILAAPVGGSALNPEMKGEILEPPVRIITARRV